MSGADAAFLIGVGKSPRDKGAVVRCKAGVRWRSSKDPDGDFEDVDAFLRTEPELRIDPCDRIVKIVVQTHQVHRVQRVDQSEAHPIGQDTCLRDRVEFILPPVQRVQRVEWCTLIHSALDRARRQGGWVGALLRMLQQAEGRSGNTLQRY